LRQVIFSGGTHNSMLQTLFLMNCMTVCELAHSVHE
jgi:hypothetical protein